MDTSINPDGPTGAGVAGGVILVLLHITGLQLLETIVLAAVGAAVSYATTLALKWLVRRWGKRERERD